MYIYSGGGFITEMQFKKHEKTYWEWDKVKCTELLFVGFGCRIENLRFPSPKDKKTMYLSPHDSVICSSYFEVFFSLSPSSHNRGGLEINNFLTDYIRISLKFCLCWTFSCHHHHLSVKQVLGLKYILCMYLVGCSWNRHEEEVIIVKRTFIFVFCEDTLPNNLQ